MNRRLNRLRHQTATALAATLLTLGLCLSSGCGRESEQPAVLTSEQITGSVPDVFKGAPADIGQLAADVVDALGKQDYTTAWAKLQELNVRPELTPDQKAFVAESIASVGAEVNKAEESGSEAAQQALEFYRANK